MRLRCTYAFARLFATGIAALAAGCQPSIVGVPPGDPLYIGLNESPEAPSSEVPAPYAPVALTCELDPLGKSDGNICALIPAIPADPQGRIVSYVDGGSSCPEVLVNSATGAVSFAAPVKGAGCVIAVKAHNGSAWSPAVVSSMITGQNNAPATPDAVSCPLSPIAGTAGLACTFTAANPADIDGDPVTYLDGGSTCAAVSVNATTGMASFTAPDKGASCQVKVRAYDGSANSTAVSSATITGINNAPSMPSLLSCATTPLGASSGNTCVLTAASPADLDGDTVTYSDNGSTCPAATVNGATGNATFTAPAKGATCVVRVRAHDGSAYSGAVSSATITGQNNVPATPSTISCPATPTAGSAGNACTLTAASPVDPDGDSVTYSDGGSTCAAVSVNATTGNATFTAPAKGNSCIVKVRAHDGSVYSSSVSSVTITAQNNSPNAPGALSCATTPLGGSTGNVCTLTAASPTDPDGDSVTYSDDGSTCAAVSVNSGTGNATFTAPAKNATCVVKIRAHDGTSYSSSISSATITGQNNAPSAPVSLSCNTTPLGASTGNTCTLTTANPVDADGDLVTYSNNGSTCGAVSVTGATGAVMFTAPAKGFTCEIKVRAHDGLTYSPTVTSVAITGQNNAPSVPGSLVCPATPTPGSTGNSCTLTAASPADVDGDTVTYSNDGGTCGAASVSANGATVTFTAPASGATCVMKVRAFDGSAYSSAVSSATITGASTCPADFIAVSGNPTYGTSDFCVAKFQAKGIDGSGNLLAEGSGYWFNSAGSWYLEANLRDMGAVRAASRPDGTPWTNISRDDASAACAAMGAGYHLITNAEWQTVARNIENTAANWSGGTVGNGVFNSGHSDGSTDGNAVVQGFAFNGGSSFDAGMLALASCGGINCASVALNDANGYAGTGNTSGQAVGSGWEQKRTHRLSNGEVIWDFAGNVWQWVADNNTTNFGTNRFISQLTALSNPTTGTIGGVTGNAKLLFGPAGDFTAKSSGQYGGLGYGYINYNDGNIIRGGGGLSFSYAGVFAVDLSYGPSFSASGVGFRCAR